MEGYLQKQIILLQGFLVVFEFSGEARCPNKGIYLSTLLVYSISNFDFVYSRKLVLISQTYPFHKLSCLLLLYVLLILFLLLMRDVDML